MNAFVKNTSFFQGRKFNFQRKNIKYVNQNDYPRIPYRTRAKVEGLTDEQRTTDVAQSGCGLCFVSMVVDCLTDKTLEIEDSVRLSEEGVANHSP